MSRESSVHAVDAMLMLRMAWIASGKRNIEALAGALLLEENDRVAAYMRRYSMSSIRRV